MTRQRDVELAEEELVECTRQRKSAPPEVVATVLYDLLFNGGLDEDDSVDEPPESGKRRMMRT